MPTSGLSLETIIWVNCSTRHFSSFKEFSCCLSIQSEVHTNPQFTAFLLAKQTERSRCLFSVLLNKTGSESSQTHGQIEFKRAVRMEQPFLSCFEWCIQNIKERSLELIESVLSSYCLLLASYMAYKKGIRLSLLLFWLLRIYSDRLFANFGYVYRFGDVLFLLV